MGDFRADIKIEMTILDKKYEHHFNINYHGHDGVDRNIIEFFENCWDDAYTDYIMNGGGY